MARLTAFGLTLGLAFATPSAAAQTYLGTFTVHAATELVTFSRSREQKDAPPLVPGEGKQFVVVSFPDTSRSTTSIVYRSAEFRLKVGNEELKPDAISRGFHRATGKTYFVRGVDTTEYTASADALLAVAFAVPKGAKTGVLSVRGQPQRVSW